MLYGFLLTLYIINCFLLIGIILIQKTKSSMGLGALGGSSQTLFGGSGGQDIFQKITWILGALFMAGSLGLSLMRSRDSRTIVRVKTAQTAPAIPLSEPVTDN